MTGKGSAGARSRSFLAMSAAVLTVALMLAVPVMAAFDSDAAITEDEAGYSIEMVNPTDAEIDTYGYISKSGSITIAAIELLGAFNRMIYSNTVTTGSYTTTYAEGEKHSSDSVQTIFADTTEAEDVTITYTATADGSLIRDDVVYPDDYKEAADAIKQYMGDTVSVGDVLKVTGKLKIEESSKIKYDLAKVSEGVSVFSAGEVTRFMVLDADLTIEFTHGGTTKAITFSADRKFMLERDVTYDYKGVAYADLTDSSPCTISYGTDKYSETAGKYCYTIEGEDYGIDYILSSPQPIDTTADLMTDAELNEDLTYVQNRAAGFPEGTDNVTVKRTYSDAVSAYEDVELDVIGDDLMKLLLIIGGVVLGIIVLIIIAVIVIIVVVRKNKRAQ